MQRDWFMRGVTCAACCVLASIASAQAPVLHADLVDARQIRLAVPTSIASDFTTFVKPTPQQLDAARELVDGARQGIGWAVNRHLRQVRPGVTLEVGDASEVRMKEQVRTIEQALLSDLKALLTDEQTEGWSRFLMARNRRLILSLSQASSRQAVDLTSALAKAGVAEDSVPGLKAALLTSEREVDAATIQVAQNYITWTRAIRTQNPQADTLFQEYRVSSARADQARTAAWRRVVPLVPRDVQDALYLARARQHFSGSMGTMFGSDEAPPAVREVLTLDLTPQQKATIEELRGEFRAKYVATVRTWADTVDSNPIDGNDATSLLLQAREQLRATFESGTLALLSPAQREEFERAPVLEPGSTFEVDDEPLDPSDVSDRQP